jgi:hypothetical protein
MSLLPPGTPAPDFSLTAVVSQRTVSPHDTPGKLLLIFHSYETAALAGSVIAGLRDLHPDPQRLLIASVADLRVVPRLLKGVAEKIMRDAYAQAAQQVPRGQDAADHVIILPDWAGTVFDTYRVPQSNGQVALVLVDEGAVIGGSYLGDAPLEGALSLLDGRQT